MVFKIKKAGKRFLVFEKVNGKSRLVANKGSRTEAQQFIKEQ